MRSVIRGRAIMAAVLAAGLPALGCDEGAPPTAPGDINVYVQQIVGGQQNPTASPSPGSGSGTLPEGSTIRVGIFGQEACTGAAPPNSARQVRIACRGAGITATPKDRFGNDLDASIHGPDISWTGIGVTFGGGGGAVNCTPGYLGTNFNVFCSCAAGSAGTRFTLFAKVKDKTGEFFGECVP